MESNNDSDSTASVCNSEEKHLDGDFICSKLEDKVDEFIRCGDFTRAISLLESCIETLKNNISSSTSQIRLLTAAKSMIEEGYSNGGGALKTDQSSLRSIFCRVREAQGRELNVDKETQPLVFDFSKITLEEDKEAETEEEDWEKMADQNALPVLGGISTESTSEHCVFDNPVETKRRGRGSFLYKKTQVSALYSDQVYGVRGPGYDFDQDQEEEYEEYQGKSHHSTEPTYAEGAVTDHRNVEKLSFDDMKSTSPQEERPRLRPETSPRVANRLIFHAMGLKPSTDFNYEDLKKQEEARKDRLLMRLRQKTEAWGSDVAS
ncbi:hypothetical protein ZOSMA_2G03290 [Zostera marina]|uniref:Uncharacterized protein n=1 Tax=Zostera marina TaxID=29655 RepID=A0A0K9PB44_ZOSMR|nr:hypothetical protein ZOSMA_2G03290 [Zostera marina]